MARRMARANQSSKKLGLRTSDLMSLRTRRSNPINAVPPTYRAMALYTSSGIPKLSRGTIMVAWPKSAIQILQLKYKRPHLQQVVRQAEIVEHEPRSPRGQ